jgi:hypothetical protein
MPLPRVRPRQTAITRLAAGTLTIAAGASSGTITLTIIGDRTKESNETFTVVLSSPVNATIGTGTATVTILDDEKALTAVDAPAASNALPRP